MNQDTSGERNINPIYVLKGHKNLIHDIDWSHNDKLLMSSSSDFTVKIWQIPENLGNK